MTVQQAISTPMLVGADVVAEYIVELVLIGVFGVISYYVRKFYKEWHERGGEVDSLGRMINGVEGSEQFKGIVDIMESHDNELDTHGRKIKNIKGQLKEAEEERENVKERIDRLKKRHDEGCGTEQ